MRPLYEALTDEKFKNQLQFHMPGHLRGRGFEGFDINPSIDVRSFMKPMICITLRGL